jgi:alpha-L-rhamnosidase
MAAFYTKWLRDLADAQQYYNATRGSGGEIPDCVPYYDHGSLPGDPAWAAAYPLITNWVSSYYSDTRLIQRHYAGIKAFVDYEIGRAATTNGILQYGVRTPLSKTVFPSNTCGF